MEQPDFKAIAAQLRKPAGNDGLETADRMNRSNGNMIRRCIDHLALQPGDNILEIGPGSGLHVPYLFEQEKDIHYAAADISDTMVTLAGANNKGLVQEGLATFVLAEITEDCAAMPFADQHFDRVFTVNTLYFWDNAPAQAKEIMRVLKPGGTLALCFATEEFMRRLPFTQYGFHLYTIEKAKTLLEEAGFTVESASVEKESVMSNAGENMEREFVVMMALKKQATRG